MTAEAASKLRERGYAAGDFEQHAADIAVDHPNVVESYRAAQAIADAEELRKAIVNCRAIFDTEALCQGIIRRGRCV